MLRRIRWMLSQGSPAPGARHALPRRSLARASAISVALSSLLLVPLAPANAAACNPDSTTESTSGTHYTILAFKNVGSCDWSVPTGVSSADVLVVGGGGGGGSRSGGGGGAGGLVEVTSYALSVTSVSVTVGAGGAGAAGENSTNTAQSGTSSSFISTNGLTALGGGAGTYTASAQSGGSGGGSLTGSAGNVTAQVQKTLSGSAISGITFGNSGSKGAYDNDGDRDFWAAGGGGGAGSAGGLPNQGGVGLTALTNRDFAVGGPGGEGREVTWISSTVASALGIGEVSSSKTYFAGGGGGGMGADGSAGGTGGVGGGADGTKTDSTPNSGTSNTGGGGGGSGYDDESWNGGPTGNAPAGSGGSGVVVVRYATPVPATVQNFTASTRLVDSDTDADSVTLTWDALTSQTPAVSSYSIDYSTNSDFSSATNTTVTVTNSSAATPNSKTITGLTDGATHYFRIKAVNSEGSSNSYAETSSVAVSNEDYALDADGANYASHPDGSVIPEDSSANFSVEMWFKADALTGNTMLMSQGTSDATYYLKLSGASLVTHFDNSEDETGFDLETGRWYHIAHTLDTSTSPDTSKVYVDGSLIFTSTGNRLTYAPSSSNGFHIGALSRNQGEILNGQIDQVKIWNDVRTKSEIEASMHAWGNPVISDTSLISHYDFNDDTQATTLRDQAGSNDLTYTSVATSDLKPLVQKDTSSRSGYAVYEFKRSYLTAAGGWTAPAGVSTTQYLVVGGGGAGGSTNYGAAGGGGGGRVLDSNLDLTDVSSVKVTVGQGGIPIPAATSAVTPDAGSDGQSSILVPAGGSEISALGGGGGANARLYSLGQPAPSASGWTGGGGSAHASAWSAGSQGIGGASFSGGNGNPSATGQFQAGGGGGGAGGLGAGATNGQGGTGGAGISSNIKGSALLFGGGGGGGLRYDSGTAPGVGQAGGGSGGDGVDGVSGTANTGGGGGGAGEQSRPNPGGSGGSGVVILAYSLAPSAPTITSVSSITATTASVAFTAPASAPETVTKYQWSIDATNWTDFSGTTSPQTVSGLTQNNAYSNFKIRAVSGSYEGTASAAATSFTTLAAYSITYNSNSATGGTVPASQTKTNGVDLTLAANSGSLVRTGYTFAGWNTQADGLGTDYSAGSTYSTEAADELFAKWTVSFYTATGDTYLNSGSSAGSSKGDGSSLLLKNAQDATSSSFNRISYLEFETDPDIDWEGALLQLAVSANSDGSSGTQWGVSYTTFNVNVYGTNDTSWDESSLTFNNANSSDKDWGVNTDTWPWTPDAGTFLGTLSIPTSGSTIGNVYSLTTEELDNFLDADSDGNVTFVLVRSDIDPQANLAFASKENDSYPAPRLSVGQSGLTYTVAYDINGGTGTLPSPGSYIDGGSSYTVATPSGLTAPSGSTFVGWNTKADGSGTDYAAASSYSTARSVTLYAKWSSTYTATYVYDGADGGTRPVDAQFVFGSGSPITLPAPTKTGFYLAGFYSDSSFTTFVGRAGAFYSPSANSIIYAKWTKLLINLDGASTDSLANSGTTWTSILPGSSQTVGTASGATYFDDGSGVRGFSFDGNTASVSFAAGTGAVDGAITVLTWVKPGNLRPGWNILATRWFSDTSGTGASDWHFAIKHDGSKYRLNVFTTGKSDAYGSFEFPATSADVWYQVGFTIDASNNLQFYVNGNVDGAAQSGASHTSNQSSLLWLGDGRTSSELGFVGKMSTFQIYKGALTASEVRANFEASASTFGVSTSYTVTYNKGDYGTGSNVTASKTDGVALTLPDSATANSYFTRTGYTVTSWSTNSDGSTSDYALGGSYTTDAIETLYPVWTADTYTITFNKGASGTGSDVTATKTHDVDFTIPNSATSNGYFTRTGYTVSSWSTSADGSTSDFAFGATYSTEAADTLYPVWTANTYTVTYNYNGATGGNSAATSSYTVDGIVVSLPTPTKTGYTFAGWYSDSGLTASIGAAGASYSPSADVTAYAKWSAATFTVIYAYNDADGGNSTASSTFTTGLTVITLPTPTRTGYTFGGWYSDSGLTSSIGAAGASYSPSVNLTIYAKWNAIDYSVTYNTTNVSGEVTTSATGGAAPTDSSSYNIGDSVPVSSNSGSLYRNGYTFAGWVTNADGTGTALNSGQVVVVGSANINFYPQWIANTYTYTYNLNGGAGDLSGAPTSWTAGTSGITLPSTGFTKTGYTFGGWSKVQNGSAQSSPFINLADATLYAVWNIKTINYGFDKGTATGLTIANWPANSSATFGSSVALPDLSGTTVTIGGDPYAFFGWSYAGSTYASGDAFVLGETGPTFTANWVQLFDVTYGFAGGTESSAEGNGDSECVSGGLCTDGQSIVLRPAPTRTGYNFNGWKVQTLVPEVLKAGGSAQVISATSYLFYAKWTAIDYTFSFDPAGGANYPNSEDRNIGQLLTMPNPGGRAGYTFAGWTPDSGSSLYAVGSTYLVGSAGKSFVATWTPNVYTVSFDWQGATGTPTANSSYTVGTGNLSLPAVGDMVRDGYTFAGWSVSPSGSLVSNFQPTADDVLYARWDDGNYTLTYDAKGGIGSGAGSVARTGSVTIPTPVRANFTFDGWYDQANGGSKLADGGASFTPSASTKFYARWVQNSLYGVDEATLETASTFTASDSTGTDSTLTHGPTGTSARVQIPAGSLPPGTVVKVRYFKDTDRQSALIDGDNDYFFSLLVSWLYGSGDSATVPNTAAGKPISVTLNNSAINAGAMVYQVIGNTVTELGRATADGFVTVELTEDPEIVIAATKPEAPTAVTASAGDTALSVSWTAGANGGAEITSYTATAQRVSDSAVIASCTTATTSCVISGLVNNTAYTVSVTATNAIGTSNASTASAAATPVGASYVVTFDSNGGSSVLPGSFFSGGTTQAPVDPSKSGYSFVGWSTVLDDATTKISFPYAPGVLAPITLYALWEPRPASPSAPPVVSTDPDSEARTENWSWTKRKADGYAKVYSKNVIGVGKVQFFFNGREIAWIRAVDETDPKLRTANGFHYLVRTVELELGKNVIEIYVDGDRVRRVAYTRR